jgi:hypothetical protein
MSWKKWHTMAMRYQLRIVNWPTKVETPGPKFDIKSLGTGDLRLLVGEYIICKQKGDSFMNALRFERWTESESNDGIKHEQTFNELCR